MYYRGGDAAAGALTRRIRVHASAARPVAALALLCALASPPAFAARPFTTEDADIIKQSNCELELAQTEQRARAAPTESNTSGQLACGIGLSTELGIAAMRVARGSEHWPAVAFVGKTGLRPMADGDLGVAVAYSLVGEQPHGGEFRQTRALGILVATQSSGRMLFHGNLGYTRDRIASVSTTLWALAAERIGERFDFGGELFGESTRSAWLGASARYAVLPDRLIFDTSYAVRGNSSRTRRATVGITFAF